MAGLDSKKRKLLNGSGSSSSTTSIGNLNDDILLEIVHRIPCKSVVRCKSVCKRWFFLISNSIPYILNRLVARHGPVEYQIMLNCHIRQEIITPLPQPHHDVQISLNFLPRSVSEIHPPFVVASSNGLLLCTPNYFGHSYYKFTPYPFLYYICNPITKQWVALPPVYSSLPYSRPYTYIGFFCDPCYDIDTEGCVKVNPDRRFTVVRIPPFEECQTDTFIVEIFSSDKGRWIEFTVSSPHQFTRLSLQYHTAILCNKRMHWLNCDKILVYDPCDNQVDCIDFPAVIIPSKRTPDKLYLGLCRGTLWITQFLRRTFSIWEIKDYNKKEWTLVHKVNLHERPRLGANLTVIATHFHDPDIVYFKFRGEKVVSYNIRSDTWEEMGDTLSPYYYCTIALSLPLWPTSIPAISAKEKCISQVWELCILQHL